MKRDERVTIKVQPDVHGRLKAFQRELQAARNEDFTLGEAIDEAIKAAAYVLKSAERALAEGPE